MLIAQYSILNFTRLYRNSGHGPRKNVIGWATMDWNVSCLSLLNSDLAPSNSGTAPPPPVQWTFVDKVRTVWSSFQWISVSSRDLSSLTSSHRQPAICVILSGNDRSGWRGDMNRTTRHLCASLHMKMTPTHRCPGLECWTSVRDDMSSNPL